MTVIFDMPEADYRAHPAIANSDLTMVRRSPGHLLARRRTPEVVTQAKLDGRALHVAILEPQLFMQRYSVLPANMPKDLRYLRDAKEKKQPTIDSIRRWDEWEANNAGRITLDADKYERFMAVADNIRSHPDLKPYFDATGESEVSIFAEDPITKLPVKCRIDRRVKIGNYRVALDPKSTEDPRPDAFSRSAYAYDYFKQAAFYTDVCKWAGEDLDLFLFIAFEKEDPYGIKVYEVSEDDIDFGRRQYRRALDTWAECVRNNDFPVYNTGIEVLTRPAYAKEY